MIMLRVASYINFMGAFDDLVGDMENTQVLVLKEGRIFVLHLVIGGFMSKVTEVSSELHIDSRSGRLILVRATACLQFSDSHVVQSLPFRVVTHQVSLLVVVDVIHFEGVDGRHVIQFVLVSAGGSDSLEPLVATHILQQQLAIDVRSLSTRCLGGRHIRRGS